MKERILTAHPDGKKGVNILKSKYDFIRANIIEVLKEVEEITYVELNHILKNHPKDTFDGSVAWYVVTVKLDLEAKNIIERVPKTSPHKIRLVQQ